MTDEMRVAAIESAFVSHWRHFGLYPGASLHDVDGVVWYESPIPHLPYNAVISTRIERPDVDAVMAAVLNRYRDRGVPSCGWCSRTIARPIWPTDSTRRGSTSRMRFVPRCRIDADATAPLFETHHH
jgi:hypothetical protein